MADRRQTVHLMDMDATRYWCGKDVQNRGLLGEVYIRRNSRYERDKDGYCKRCWKQIETRRKEARNSGK